MTMTLADIEKLLALLTTEIGIMMQSDGDEIYAWLGRTDATRQQILAAFTAEQQARVEAERDYKEAQTAYRKIYAEVQSDNERLRASLFNVATSGVRDIDPRIKYVEVQIDRDDWAELTRLSEAKPASKEK